MVETAHTPPAKTYAGQVYNSAYLARKYHITKQQARDLIRKLGYDRDRLNEAARALRTGG